MTKYIVIENFYEDCLEAVYQRFHAKGRMMPEGLYYLDSWLAKDGSRCFQLMETEDPALFQEWIKNWSDLTQFEVVEIGEKPNAE